MQVLNSIKLLPEAYFGCVIALGTFDGIHLGHLDIINTAKKYAKNNNAKVVVFSFSNHPLDEINPKKAPFRLCSEEKKQEIFKELNIDVLLNLRFDRNLSAITPNQFVFDLKKFFSPSFVIVGNNYSYGHLGAGTAQTLVESGKQLDFSVVARDLIKINGITVSSTNIRNFLRAGSIGLANRLLGRCYSLKGIVVHGNARGRELGFPTANLNPEMKNQMIPANGVYISKVKVNDKEYKAVVSIGTNPTFNIQDQRIEVHILDFNEDIYGEKIEVFFLKKIRDEKKFSTIDALIENINKDVLSTKQFFS